MNFNTDNIYTHDITKYHIQNENFFSHNIFAAINYIKHHYTYIAFTHHFILAVKNDIHNINIHSMNDILDGVCFEYKMNDDNLYRATIRVYGKLFDTIYTIQPVLYEGKIYIKLITCYTNEKGDNHKTLDIKNYN